MKARRPGRGTKPAASRSPNKLFAVFGIVLGLGLLYGWNSVFLGPQSRQAGKVKADLATAQANEKNLRRQLGQLQKLATETQTREGEIARLGQLVPASPDVAGAILALNDAATQTHVAWSSFVPSPGTASPTGTTPLAIAMKVGGSFDQIFDYLGRLETLDRLVVVDSVQLSGGGGGNGQPGGQLAADIKARMFSAGTAAPASATAVAGTSAPSPAGTSALPKVGD